MDVVLYVEQGIWLKILKQRSIWEMMYWNLELKKMIYKVVGVIIDNHKLNVVKKMILFKWRGSWSKWKYLFKFEYHTAQ